MRSRDWVSVVAGGAAATTSVLAAGGAFRWAQGVVALLIGVAVGAQLPSRRRLSRISPLLVVLLVGGALTACSLIPLPAALREWIDPVGSALREDGASLVDLAPWPALSRDAPGSLRALIYFITLLGFAAIALRLAPSERGRYRLVAFVGALAGLAAIVTGVHEVLGAHRLYGLYTPHATPTILGPLLNENHLGALMAIGTCVAIGLVLYPRQRSSIRAIWMAVVLLCGGMTAASHSRGAVLALVAGAIVTTGLLLAQRFTSAEGPSRRSRFTTSSLPLGIVGACVVVLVVYSSAGSVSAELHRTSLSEVSKPRSKFAAWRSAEQLVEESPWVGVGRGGFEPSFTRVHPASGAVTFGYLENEYIQAVVDWGIPGGVLFGIALLWFAGVAVRRWRDTSLAAGAIGALTAIAVQSNVDYGVELLGLAVPVTILAATLSYVAIREDSGRSLAVARGLRLVELVALLGGAVLAFSNHTISLSEDHERLAERPTEESIHAALERHPLDYLGYAVASERIKGASSIRLLNHALRLHPTHPGLHRRAGQLLAASAHPDQAAIEYASALRATAQPEKLLGEITSAFPPAIAAAAIPTEFTNIDQIVAHLRDLHHDDVATLWLGRILVIRPHDVHACNTLYELSLSRGDLEAAELAGRSCVAMMPDRQTRTSLATVMLQQKHFQDVLNLLGDVESWHGVLEEKADAWLQRCDAYIGLEHWDEATGCLHHLDASGDLLEKRHDEITKRLENVHEQRAANHLGSAVTAP
ncbi:hypothetical protein BH11MYX1_BH11MYX1_01020 [soil metagenome]